jgi:hypothetical protein
MLVVAIVGLAMGGGAWGYRMWRLSGEYTSIAHQHWFDVENTRACQAPSIHVTFLKSIGFCGNGPATSG